MKSIDQWTREIAARNNKPEKVDFITDKSISTSKLSPCAHKYGVKVPVFGSRIGTCDTCHDTVVLDINQRSWLTLAAMGIVASGHETWGKCKGCAFEVRVNPHLSDFDHNNIYCKSGTNQNCYP